MDDKVYVMLRKLGVFVLLVGLGWIVAGAANRIFTNPRPDAHLKRLFPAAAAFSPLGGDPLHFTAYAADPRATPTPKPLGFAFWTTDLVRAGLNAARGSASAIREGPPNGASRCSICQTARSAHPATTNAFSSRTDAGTRTFSISRPVNPLENAAASRS